MKKLLIAETIPGRGSFLDEKPLHSGLDRFGASPTTIMFFTTMNSTVEQRIQRLGVESVEFTHIDKIPLDATYLIGTNVAHHPNQWCGHIDDVNMRLSIYE